MSATSSSTRILPRDVKPGMFAKFYVSDVDYGQEYMQFCEILSVTKIRRDGVTKYDIRIAEPTTRMRPKPRKTTRTFQPTNRLTVRVDEHGNRIAREGCDRCFCGCKYWENDVCVDCGTHVTQQVVRDA